VHRHRTPGLRKAYEKVSLDAGHVKVTRKPRFGGYIPRGLRMSIIRFLWDGKGRGGGSCFAYMNEIKGGRDEVYEVHVSWTLFLFFLFFGF